MMTEKEWLEQKAQAAAKTMGMPIEGRNKSLFDAMMQVSKESFLEGIQASVDILTEQATQVQKDIDAGKVEKGNEDASFGLITTCLVAGKILTEFHRSAKAFFDIDKERNE